MKHVGYWWTGDNIEMVEVNGQAYALYGWNGEEYDDCWKCSGEHLLDASYERYTLRPVYRFQAEGTDLSALEENSPEWDHALEVVDYEIR